jgi:hypothetical protein
MVNKIDDSIQIDVTVPSPGTLEDFLTYVELDPENNIERSANQVTWTNANRNVAASVYKDYGTGYFGDFTHRLITQCSNRGTVWSYCILGVWGLSNGAHTLQDMVQSQGLSLFWSSIEGNEHVLRLSNYGGTIVGDNSIPLSLNTEYYLTISRVGTNVTCVIKNINNTTIDTLSIVAPNATAYSTILAYYSYNNAGWSHVSTGYDKNLSLY